MKIQYGPSSVQMVDTLTKSFGTTSFQDLLIKIKVTTYIPHLSCGRVLEDWYNIASYTLACDILHQTFVCLSVCKHRSPCTFVEECCLVT